MQHNLIVCCKIVPDLEMAGEQEYSQQDFSLLRRALSSLDVTALELALRFRDSSPTARLTALSVGDRRGERILKNLYAVGYQQVIVLTSGQPVEGVVAAHTIATCLHSALQQLSGGDIILFGATSDDSQHGQTAMLVAEMLGWPCISQVTEIAPVPDSRDLLLTCRYQTMTLQQRITPPCVLTVGDGSAITSLRIATLKEKLQANSRQVECIPLADGALNVDSSVCLSYQPPDKTCRFIVKASAEETAAYLYQHYIKNNTTY